MIQFAKEMIFAPLVRRGGTFLGAYLIGLGVHDDQVQIIAAGAIAAALVAFDLALSYSAKKESN